VRIVAIPAITVGLHRSTDACAGQTIAILPRFEQASFLIVKGPSPSGVRCVAATVPHLHNVAYPVVGVALGVGPHRVTVPWMHDANAQGIVVRVGDWCAADLTQVLTSFRLNEPVCSVVCIYGHWLHADITEVDGLLGVIADGRDISGRIIDIMQIL